MVDYFVPDNDEWGTRWLVEPPYTLKDYHWGSQPKAVLQVILSYMESWRCYTFDVSEAEKYLGKVERPLPILHLYGPNNVGKTEIVGRGLARWFIFNLGFKSFQYIHWATYVADQLNEKKLDISLEANFLILDDFDGYRPVPKSGSPWLLDKLSSFIKNRKHPTVIISNRTPGQLGVFLSKPVEGDSTDDTIQSSTTLISAIARKAHGSASFVTTERHGPTSMAEFNQRLRGMAAAQDFYGLGFPREINGKEVVY